MELSLLCDVKVFLFIYDHTETKLIHYQSEHNDDIKKIFKENGSRVLYTNDDYLKIEGKRMINSDDEDEMISKIALDLKSEEFSSVLPLN